MTEFAKNQSPHPEAVDAHDAAQYAVLAMNIDYDSFSGLMKATVFKKVLETSSEDVEMDMSTIEIEGPPGQIMTHESFYFPRGKEDDKRLALAFELGYLFGKRQKEESKDKQTDDNESK